MKIWIAAIVTSLAAVTSIPAAAQIAAPVVVSPALRARAIELAELLNNEATLRMQTTRMLHQSLPAVLKADASFQQLETEYPGISAQFIDVMEPIAVASAIRKLPDYQAATADVYVRNLNENDLVSLIAFFKSPLGVKIVRLGNEGLDFTQMLKGQVASGGDAPITTSDIGAALTPAIGKAVGGLDSKEQLDMVHFAMTPAGRKLPKVNAEVRDLAATWANRPDPAAEAEVAKAVTALVQRRMAGKKDARP